MYLKVLLSLTAGFITGVLVIYHLFSNGELVRTRYGFKFKKTRGLITYTLVIVERPR